MRIPPPREGRAQGRITAKKATLITRAGAHLKPACTESPHTDDTPASRAISALARQNRHSVAKRGQTLPGRNTCEYLT